MTIKVDCRTFYLIAIVAYFLLLSIACIASESYTPVYGIFLLVFLDFDCKKDDLDDDINEKKYKKESKKREKSN